MKPYDLYFFFSFLYSLFSHCSFIVFTFSGASPCLNHVPRSPLFLSLFIFLPMLHTILPPRLPHWCFVMLVFDIMPVVIFAERRMASHKFWTPSMSEKTRRSGCLYYVCAGRQTTFPIEFSTYLLRQRPRRHGHLHHSHGQKSKFRKYQYTRCTSFEDPGLLKASALQGCTLRSGTHLCSWGQGDVAAQNVSKWAFQWLSSLQIAKE